MNPAAIAASAGPWMSRLGTAATVATTAAGLMYVPSAIKEVVGLSDRHFGTDASGGRGRANMLADAQWRALMADEMEAQDALGYETALNDLLSPLSQMEPWDGLTGVQNFIQERELNDVLARDQMRLGQLSQVYQDNSFEALAMRMGL